MKDIKVGNPLNDETRMGALSSAEHRDKVASYIQGDLVIIIKYYDLSVCKIIIERLKSLTLITLMVKDLRMSPTINYHNSSYSKALLMKGLIFYVVVTLLLDPDIL